MFGLLLGLVAQACNDDSDPYSDAQKLLEKQDAQISQHLEGLNLEAEKDQYSVYRIPLQGNASGRAMGEGDVAEVTYTLTQLDGTLMGSGGESMRLGFNGQAFNAGQYLPFYLYQVHAHMREGERYRFYIPSQYAYGRYELAGVIPGQSIVVMDIEVDTLYKSKEALLGVDIDSIESVISAEGLEADTLGSEIRKVVVKEVSEGEQPQAGDKVSVYYTGKLTDGTIFDSNTAASQSSFSFEIGKEQVINGFEVAVKSLKEGEKAIFYMPSVEAYGNQGFYLAPKVFRTTIAEKPENAGVRIPPHSPLVFEIEVEKITKK